MIVCSTEPLPVGQVYNMDGTHLIRDTKGIPRTPGPVFILREVSFNDFKKWIFETTGGPLNHKELSAHARGLLRYYEISMD